MQMTKRGEPLAINQALNKPRQKLGLSLPIWMGIVIASLMALLLRFFRSVHRDVYCDHRDLLGDRPQTPQDVPTVGPQLDPEELL